MHKYQQTMALRNLIEMLGDTNPVLMQFTYAVSSMYYMAPNDWLVHEVGVPTRI
jgi:hypothetical protein